MNRFRKAKTEVWGQHTGNRGCGTLTSMSLIKNVFLTLPPSDEQSNSCSQPAETSFVQGHPGLPWAGSSCQQSQPSADGAAKGFCVHKVSLLCLFLDTQGQCKETWEKTCPWFISKGPMKCIPSSAVYSSASRYLKRRNCTYFLMK